MSLSDLPKLWTTSSNISKFWFSKCWKLVKSFQKKLSLKNIGLGDQLLLKKYSEIFYFLSMYFTFLKCAQFLSALFIILIGLKKTLFSEKMLISNRCIWGFMPNLNKKSLTVSKLHGEWWVRLSERLSMYFVVKNPCVPPQMHMRKYRNAVHDN